MATRTGAGVTAMASTFSSCSATDLMRPTSTHRRPRTASPARTGHEGSWSLTVVPARGKAGQTPGNTAPARTFTDSVHTGRRLRDCPPVSYGVAVQPDNEQIIAAKGRLRATLIQARRSRDDGARRAAGVANTGHLLAALTGVSCVAAYLPLPTEPLDPRLLDELATTMRVLVPVVTGASPLDWCAHPGPV